MTLDQLSANDRGTVTEIRASGPIRQRLMDMGLLPAAEITVERFAPTGEPVWIRVCGGQVALRRSEARTVIVEVRA